MPEVRRCTLACILTITFLLSSVPICSSPLDEDSPWESLNGGVEAFTSRQLACAEMSTLETQLNDVKIFGAKQIDRLQMDDRYSRLTDICQGIDAAKEYGLLVDLEAKN